MKRRCSRRGAPNPPPPPPGQRTQTPTHAITVSCPPPTDTEGLLCPDDRVRNGGGQISEDPEKVRATRTRPPPLTMVAFDFRPSSVRRPDPRGCLRTCTCSRRAIGGRPKRESLDG